MTNQISPMNGPDLVYQFTLKEPRSLKGQVSAFTSTYLIGAYLRKTCEEGAVENEVICKKSIVLGNPVLEVPNLDKGTYYLFVDGLWQTGGKFELNLQLGAPE